MLLHDSAPSSTPTLFALALGSSLLAAVLTQAVTYVLTVRTSKRAAAYLALRLAVIIEAFGEQCLANVFDHDIAEATNDAVGGRSSTLPSLTNFPDDEAGWRALPADLISDVLNFPPRVQAGQRGIDNMWEHVGAEEALEACRTEAVFVGCEASLLAKTLRRRMGLSPMQIKWDWPRYLDDFRATIYEQRRKRDEAVATRQANRRKKTSS